MRIFAKIISCLAIIALMASPATAGLQIGSTPANPVALGSGTTNVAVQLLADGTDLATGLVDSVIPAGGIGSSFSVSVVPVGSAVPIAGPFPSTTLPPISPWTTFAGAFFRPGGTAGPEAFTGFNVNIPDTVPAVFDVVLNDDTLLVSTTGGVAFQTTILGGTTLGQIAVAVPEPSAFLLLGLVGSGIAGINFWRRRKSAAVAEVTEQ